MLRLGVIQWHINNQEFALHRWNTNDMRGYGDPCPMQISNVCITHQPRTQLVYLNTFFFKIENWDNSKAFSFHFLGLNKNNENRTDVTTTGLPVKFCNCLSLILMHFGIKSDKLSFTLAVSYQLCHDKILMCQTKIPSMQCKETRQRIRS